MTQVIDISRKKDYDVVTLQKHYERYNQKVMDITGKTKLTGLIGHPVAHSISPQMHNEAFRQLGLDYVYLAFDISDTDLKTAVHGLKSIGIRGFNITMPHKTAMLEFMDELTPAARIAQACNTVIVEDGKMIGHTTDGIGFMRSVSDAGHDITGKKMTLLGAGGAATAICTQAALDGVSGIDLFRRNRPEAFAATEEFAQTVRKETGCPVQVYDIADLRQLKDSLDESAILVNATNVGMAPDIDGNPIQDCSLLHPELIVSDIIYNPRKTRLLQMAEAVGCPVFNGMYMLLFQGAASFECWTGQEMPVEIIRRKYFSNHL